MHYPVRLQLPPYSTSSSGTSPRAPYGSRPSRRRSRCLPPVSRARAHTRCPEARTLVDVLPVNRHVAVLEDVLVEVARAAELRRLVVLLRSSAPICAPRTPAALTTHRLISMPRRIGSAAPYSRRRPSILRFICVSSHARRRCSSGCRLLTSLATECGPPLRIASGTAVAEGAPLLWATDETVVPWAAGGMKRRDWRHVSKRR